MVQAVVAEIIGVLTTGAKDSDFNRSPWLKTFTAQWFRLLTPAAYRTKQLVTQGRVICRPPARPAERDVVVHVGDKVQLRYSND